MPPLRSGPAGAAGGVRPADADGHRRPALIRSGLRHSGRVLTLDVPVVTERLRLRAFEDADLDAVHALQSDAEVIRFLPWTLRTREQSREWLRDRRAQDRLAGDDDAVAWAVVGRDDGVLVGSVNLWWRSVEHRQGEVGFVLTRAAQGRGLAHEATAAVLDLAFAALDLHRVYGRADARNSASVRLMSRLHMRQEAHLREEELVDGEWTDTVVHAVLRREWEAARATG